MLMASAEAVMALGTGTYDGLATVDLWTLLFGQTPSFTDQAESTPILASVGMALMETPAWVAFAATGVLLLHACRKRRARRRVFRSAY